MKYHLYQWKARDTLGKKHRGLQSAVSAPLLRWQLQQKGLIKVRCQRFYRSLWGKNALRAADITQWTHALATLLKTGIALSEALTLLAQSTTKPLLQWVINDIAHQITAGKTFSQSLQRHPRYFTTLYCELIAMAEQSGTLDETLADVATYRERLAALKRQVIKALSYPCVVMTLGIGVAIVLLTLVIPRFETLFASAGASLPALTQAILGLSRTLIAHRWLIIIVAVCIPASIILLWKRYRHIKLRLQRIFIRMPLVGTLWFHSVLARMSGSFATLLRSGISLLSAIETVSHLVGYLPMQDALACVKTQVASGKSLHEALAQHSLFPALFIQLIRVGETSGQLDEMFLHLSKQYETRVDHTVAQLGELLEPAIMLILGSMVGILVVAMYLPLFQLGKAF